MKRLFIAAALVAALASPAFAWGVGPHPDGWYQVTRAGWTYWMPPHVCTVGYIAPHKVFYKPMKWIKAHGLGNLGAIVIGSYGMKIYIASDVPAAVQRDTLIHEQAEARGCGDDPYDRQFTQH